MRDAYKTDWKYKSFRDRDKEQDDTYSAKDSSHEGISLVDLEQSKSAPRTRFLRVVDMLDRVRMRTKLPKK